VQIAVDTSNGMKDYFSRLINSPVTDLISLGNWIVAHPEREVVGSVDTEKQDG